MPSPRRPLVYILRFAPLLLAALTCAQSFAQTAKVATAKEVSRLLATAAAGESPVLWLDSDPRINHGSGLSSWTAQSGGQFEARGLDPWRQANLAFGLAPDAKGGVGIIGSSAQNPVNPTAGSILFFCRPDRNHTPPFLLFSKAEWGAPGYLSLRINERGNQWELALGLANSSARGKASQLNLARMQPDEWHFIALTWQESEGITLFRYWAGSLSTGELTEGEYRGEPIGTAPGMLVIGGRHTDVVTQFRTPPLLFSGGLFRHFAIYDRVVPEDTIKRLFVASCR